VLGTIGSHAFRVGRNLPDSRLFDRLVRGRVWIGLLAVLLFGLVAINVSLLKMNAAAGHNAERLESLRIQNDRLRARVSRLGSGDRVERVAGRLGLVMPEAGNVRYLTARSGDGTRAAKAIFGGRRVPGSGPLANAVEAAPLAVDPIVIPPSTAPTATTGPAAVAPAPATAQTQQTAPVAPTTQPGTTGTAAPGAGAAPTQAPAGTPAAEPGATGQPTGAYSQPVG
jgi:cell division protein FtsB